MSFRCCCSAHRSPVLILNPPVGGGGSEVGGVGEASFLHHQYIDVILLLSAVTSEMTASLSPGNSDGVSKKKKNEKSQMDGFSALTNV